MNKINRYLRSEAATLTVLLFALAAQLPHAASVFAKSLEFFGAYPENEWITGWLFAIAMECAVLLFVVRGRIRVSYVFAIISVMMNLSYYYMHGVHLFELPSAPVWLIAIVLPIAIALYSHDVALHSTDASIQDERTKAPVAIREDKTTWLDAHAPSRPAEPATAQSGILDADESSPLTSYADAIPAIAPDFVPLALHAERKETGVERAARLASERAAQAVALHGLSAEDRRKELRKMRTNGHASTSKAELAALFDVAPSTITRDLQSLGLQ